VRAEIDVGAERAPITASRTSVSNSASASEPQSRDQQQSSSVGPRFSRAAAGFSASD
jgi:hypothetical protein